MHHTHASLKKLKQPSFCQLTPWLTFFHKFCHLHHSYQASYSGTMMSLKVQCSDVRHTTNYSISLTPQRSRRYAFWQKDFLCKIWGRSQTLWVSFALWWRFGLERRSEPINYSGIWAYLSIQQFLQYRLTAVNDARIIHTTINYVTLQKGTLTDVTTQSDPRSSTLIRYLQKVDYKFLRSTITSTIYKY